MRKFNSIQNKSKLPVAACFVVILLFSLLLLPTLTSCSIFSTEIVLNDLSITVDVGESVTTFTETSVAKFTEQDSSWWNYYRIIDDDRLAKSADTFSINLDSFTFDGAKIPFVGAIDLDEYGAKAKYTSLYTSPVGYFYARPSGVEIGVIMPAFSSGTHTISYSYNIKGLVTSVSDASVFYYQYISEINTMDIKKLHVTVNFPVAEPTLQGWLHVSSSAVGVWKQSEDKKSVSVEVEDVSAGEYVENRFLLGLDHYEHASVDQSSSRAKIEEEEEAWYASYERERRLRLAFTILDYILAVFAVVGGILFVIVMKRRNKAIDLPESPIYWRDIPDGYTGGEVSPLYFYYSNENYIDESISATMLELVRKGFITIKPDDKKKNAVITVLEKDEAKEAELRTHQKYVLDMLLMVKPRGISFTMKEFERYAKNNYERFMHLVEKYREAILNKTQRDGCYRKDNPTRDKGQRFSIGLIATGIAVVVVSGFAFFAFGQGMFFLGAGLFLGGLIGYLFLRKAKAPLTLYGQKEYNMLHALAKYMQEFSLMEEHELPELILWEDYMIFATAMGIADKVAEQLEIAYPEFKEYSANGFGMDADRFLILYFFSRSFRGVTGLNFVGNVASVIRSVQIAQSAAKAAAMASKIGGAIGGGGGRGGGSSFHGGGGGFHGGGFGGRR